MRTSNIKTSDYAGFFAVYRSAIVGIGLVVFVVVLNILLNKTSGFISWLLIAASVASVLVISRYIGLGQSDLGLQKANLKSGLRYGAVAVVVIVAVLGLAYVIHPAFFADSRYNNTALQVLFTVLIFIPFHTVLLEELVFRGVILGYLLKHISRRWAMVGSSVLFGLWHILPSLGIAESSQTISGTIGSDSSAQIASIAGVVLTTFFAGLVFCWLRIRSKSLLAPFLAHWAINGAALVFASLA